MKAIGNEADEANGITSNDRLLVEAAQRDPARFAELYENTFERVYAFVAHRVRDRDAAQDLTAEVFHQALAGLEGFEWRGTPFVAWLLGIAANLLSRHWQQLTRGQELLAEALELAGKEPAAADEKTEQRALLFQLVDRLPADQRHVILRRFVEHQSIREIAEELGRTEGAVKQLQLRAVQGLRERFKEGI